MKRILSGIAVFILVLLLFPLTSVYAKGQTVQVGIPIEERPELFVNRSMPTHGKAGLAVFLIQFPDHKNTDPLMTVEHYDKLYFSGGTFNSAWDNTTVADFFNEQSYGKLNVEGKVFDWYTAKHERSYYDHKKGELIKEAADHYASLGEDFSKFDGDGDGIFDAVAFHFAGPASSDNQDDPWYHGVNFGTGGNDSFCDVGGLRVTRIAQIAANDDPKSNFIIRVICHELMHSLGIPDLYSEACLGEFAIDLMSANLQTINPYFKLILGWIDEIEVITSDTKTVSLSPYGTKKDGKAVIVTDKFNGFFDEFYMVAYREYDDSMVIWHIDARIDEDGKSFINYNLGYDPRPDVSNGHDPEGEGSPHPFIQELSGNSKFDFILSMAGSGARESSFEEGSVLGPDSIPSSDTHDGRYTGIKIYNFKKSPKGIYTFSVSFVKDTSAPVAITTGKDLRVTDTISIDFNEFIYRSKNFDGIKVTDLNGNTLPTTVIIPKYPHNQIEIQFKDERYKNGYKIIIPTDAVRDSSGNICNKMTITMEQTTDDLFLPESEEMLKNPGYNRDNSHANFFNCEDSVVVITSLWEDHVPQAKFEFMRIDFEGNVLTQTIIDNPFVNSHILGTVYETSDGSYIFLCYERVNYTDMMFCIDKNGQLKWVNRDYIGSGKSFGESGYVKLENGITMFMHSAYDKTSETIFVDAQTGKVTPFTDKLNDIISDVGVMNLSGGRLLTIRSYRNSSGGFLDLGIVDTSTCKTLIKNTITLDKDTIYRIAKLQENDDGTFVLYCSEKNDNFVLHAFLIDAKLNLVKTLSLKTKTEFSFAYVVMMDSDGFCYTDPVVIGDHDNNQFHIYRYDRYLDLVWESESVSNFVFYFKSASGNILGYRSMWAPKRECYIDRYKSEDSLKSEHTHKLSHFYAIPSKSIAEHWTCEDCGCIFKDEGKTLVVDFSELLSEIPDTPKATEKSDKPNNNNENVGSDSEKDSGCLGTVSISTVALIALVAVCNVCLLNKKKH